MGRRQKLVVIALLTAGVASFVAAALIGNDSPPDQALSIPGVEALVPARDAEVLQQQQVGIDLEPGFVVTSFAISPDGRCLRPVEIRDFLVLADGLQRYTYQPGEGSRSPSSPPI
ncbi:MAG: hypothetical protein R2695_01930 [Acidimicrobiales bacterium]